MTTTYTVHRADDSCAIEGQGLTAREAAEMILGHNGRAYDMRLDNGFWCIFVANARGRMVPGWANGHPLQSLAATETAAWAEIAPEILYHNWRGGHLEAVTDAEYADLCPGECED